MSKEEINNNVQESSIPTAIPKKQQSSSYHYCLDIRRGNSQEFTAINPDHPTPYFVGNSKKSHIKLAIKAPREAEFFTLHSQKGALLLTDACGPVSYSVNNQKIFSGRTVILQENDLIRIGELTIHVRLHDALSPDAPPPLPLDLFDEIAALLLPPPLPVKKSALASTIKPTSKLRPISMKSRFMAFVFDVLLFSLFFKHLSSHQNYPDAIKTIGSIVKNGEDLINQLNLFPLFLNIPQSKIPLFSEALLLWIIFHCYQIFFHFITGVSLGQTLLGLHGSGGFIWNRLGGCAKTIVGMLTSFLIISELPLLFNRRPFREFVTMTAVTHGGWLVTISNLLLAIPLYLSLSFFWPLLLHPSQVEGFPLIKTEHFPNYTNTITASAPSSNLTLGLAGKNPEYPQELYSAHFKFSFVLDKPSSFIVLPAFDILKIQKNLHLRPYLDIFDPKTNEHITFRALSKSPLAGIIKEIIPKIPLFEKSYPHLYNYFKPANLLGDNYQPLSLAQSKELEQLISSSFKFGIANFPHNLLLPHPFSYGSIFFRDQLLKYIAEHYPLRSLKVEISSWNKNRVLIFTTADETSDKTQASRIKHLTIIPLNSFDSSVFSLHFDNYSLKGQEVAFAFTSMLSKELSFTKSFPLLPNSTYNVFSIVDTYSKSNLSILEREQLENYLNESYQQLFQYALGNSSTAAFEKYLTNNLQSILDTTEALTMGLAEAYKLARYRFIDDLKNLKKTLQNPPLQ
ncbi:MAG: hypothetical protein HQK50_04890 [Oligoflexia bacterium]|nr:hypothetical protein [Oligoflexia bacterium]